MDAKELIAKWAVNGFEQPCSSMIDAPVFLNSCDAYFVVRCAIVAAKKHHQAEVAGFYLAYLWDRRYPTFRGVFESAAVDSEVVRNFVRFVRKGPWARKSLGSQGKNILSKWLAAQSLQSLMDDCGPPYTLSIRDVIRLCHPRPDGDQRRLLYKHLCEHHLELGEAVRLAAIVATNNPRIFVMLDKNIPVDPPKSWPDFVVAEFSQIAIPP